jgi:uncharacterized protein YcfL
MTRWTLPLALVLVACRSTAQHADNRVATRVVVMDSATVRRLCAEPDSVLAGRRTCVLLDQSPPRIPRF